MNTQETKHLIYCDPSVDVRAIETALGPCTRCAEPEAVSEALSACGQWVAFVVVLVVAYPRAEGDARRLTSVKRLFGVPPHMLHFDYSRGHAHVRRKRVKVIVLRYEDRAEWLDILRFRELRGVTVNVYGGPYGHGGAESSQPLLPSDERLMQKLFYSNERMHSGVVVNRTQGCSASLVGAVTNTRVYCSVGTVPVYLTPFREAVNAYSAGVVPFCVEPNTGVTYILLGREMNAEVGGLWCDFGGHKQADELSSQTAAREFFEESLGVVRLSGELPRYKDYCAHVERQLMRGLYWRKVNVNIPTMENNKVKTHYMVQVDFDAQVSERFDALRRALQMARFDQAADATQTTYQANPHPAATADDETFGHYLEKESIAWWSLDRLLEVLRGQGKYRKEFFRKSFMPGLKLICTELKTLYTL